MISRHECVTKECGQNLITPLVTKLADSKTQTGTDRTGPDYLSTHEKTGSSYGSDMTKDWVKGTAHPYFML